MYDKDWADELCRDMHHIHSSPKESLRSLIKLAAVYAGVMLSVGGATMALSFVVSKYKLDQEVQTTKSGPDNNSIDTLQIKNNLIVCNDSHIVCFEDSSLKIE